MPVLPDSRTVHRVRAIALWTAVLATVPYLALKLLWLAGSDAGIRPGERDGLMQEPRMLIGNFITPDLLGGGRRVMVGNLIYKQFLAARDWPFGSALAFLLIAVMMLLLFAQALVVRKSGGERPA